MLLNNCKKKACKNYLKHNLSILFETIEFDKGHSISLKVWNSASTIVCCPTLTNFPCCILKNKIKTTIYHCYRDIDIYPSLLGASSGMLKVKRLETQKKLIDWLICLCLTPLSAISWRLVLVVYPDHRQATGKLYHLRLRVEFTLFVIYKSGHEPTRHWW